MIINEERLSCLTESFKYEILTIVHIAVHVSAIEITDDQKFSLDEEKLAFREQIKAKKLAEKIASYEERRKKKEEEKQKRKEERDKVCYCLHI